MKKNILFIIILTAFATENFAQCFLLKVNLNDCALCTAHSAFLNPLKTTLPAFAIFPTSNRQDSVDLEYLGKFSENNIRIIFNDTWNRKLNCGNGMSCVFGLSRDGEIEFSSPLKLLTDRHIDSFLQKNSAIRSTKNLQHDSLSYTMNELGVIKIHNAATNSLARTIRCTDFDLQLLANKMPIDEKKRFEKYGEIINRRTSQFIARFANIHLGENGDLLVKLSFYTTPDSLTANITDQYAIIHYDGLGNYKDVYLIEKSNDFYFSDNSFLWANEDTVYLVIKNNIMTNQSQKPGDEGNFIGLFIKKNGNYVFDSYVPYSMPSVYQQKYHYNYLSSSSSYYPLFVNKFSNDVYNLNTKESVFIIDSLEYITGINNAAFDPQVSIKADEKLNVCGVAPVFGWPNLYSVPFIYDNNLFINFYTEDLTKKYTYNWGPAVIAGNSIVSARGIKGKDALSVIYVNKDKTWTSVALPMSLFMPENLN